MFIGHFGVGFAAKPLASGASLGTLFFAAQFLDLLWPLLLVAGVERVELAPGLHPPLAFTHYPISHGLAAVAGWALALGVLHYALRRDARVAIVVGALVASHWLLDGVVHRPDLPVYAGDGPRLGLGLWGMPWLALAVELALLAGGLACYLHATRAVDAVGRYALAALVAFLIVIQFGNLFGPPPPSVAAVAWAGHAQWLLVAWGWWVDRHRQPRSTAYA